MSKRFTCSEKWSRPWFRELGVHYKALWLYILDNCDHAGIWHVDMALASFCIGHKFDEKDALDALGKQIEVLNGGSKWFVKDFITFQYGRLRNNNRIHISVLQILESEGLSKYAFGDGRTMLPSDNIDKSLRKHIYDSFGGKCAYCGEQLIDKFSIDHIVPTIAGGKSELSNLALSCESCNAYKSDFSLEEFAKRRELDLGAILERIEVSLKALHNPYKGVKDKDKDKDKDRDKGKDKDNRPNRATPEELFYLWNDKRPDGLSAAEILSPERVRHAAARLKEQPDLAWWERVIDKMAHCPFLLGQNERGWRASFDFILSPGKAGKILEGAYSNRRPGDVSDAPAVVERQ